MSLPDPRPRVLIIANGLDIGRQHGGAETFAAELALALRGMGWQPSLALLQKMDSETEEKWRLKLEQAGINATFLNPGRRRNFFASLRQAEQVCQADQIAIIHSHSQFGSLVAGWLRLADRRRRILRTVHISYEWGSSLPARLLNWIFPQFIFPLLFDAQAAVSRAIRAQVNAYPGTRIARRPAVWIPNALAEKWFRPLEVNPAAPRPKRPGPIIGCVGVLHPRKGQQVLLRAFANTWKDQPGAELWLIGDGPERAKLETYSRQLGISSQVIFWGQREDLPELLPRLDLFALASIVEGLPTVILESMLCGVPVIASDIAGNAELVQDGMTGLLFPAGDARRLGAAMQRLLADAPLAQRMAHAAYEKAQSFRMETIVRQYVELYESLRAGQLNTTFASK